MILIFYLVNIVALLLKPLQLNKIVLRYSLETLQKIQSKDPLTQKKCTGVEEKKSPICLLEAYLFSHLVSTASASTEAI